MTEEEKVEQKEVDWANTLNLSSFLSNLNFERMSLSFLYQIKKAYPTLPTQRMERMKYIGKVTLALHYCMMSMISLQLNQWKEEMIYSKVSNDGSEKVLSTLLKSMRSTISEFAYVLQYLLEGQSIGNQEVMDLFTSCKESIGHSEALTLDNNWIAKVVENYWLKSFSDPLTEKQFSMKHLIGRYMGSIDNCMKNAFVMTK
jgi:hypothetical protein